MLAAGRKASIQQQSPNTERRVGALAKLDQSHHKSNKLESHQCQAKINLE